MSGKQVKFKVVRQEYSTYRVENGQILKQMMTISDIRDVVDNDPPRARAALNDVSHVITPPETTRDDIAVTEGTPTEEDQIRELKFETDEEVINIYETRDHLILVACTVQKIFLTNKVDDQNNPRLQYQVQMSTRVVPKPHVVEQQSEDLDDKD